MRDRYGAKDPDSWRLRFHTQTAGCSLTAEQPENNIVRTAIEALAAVLGGTQSLHTNALDEVLALPTEKAAQIALRTQQVIAHETGVANTIDPLGGSYFVEALTNKTEGLAEEYFSKIEEMGKGSILEGMLVGIESGWFQSEIADAAFREQERFEKGRLVRVGVNEFVNPDERPLDILKIGPEIEEQQIDSVQRMRKGRDDEIVKKTLGRLQDAARDESENLMPPLIDCARAYCTEGEITDALRQVFGEYLETPRF
jgi:methylmalonyl-CoA mutase N-terminal domain/subunit